MRLGALGAAIAFLGVAAGAFGAHALRTRLDPGLLAAFETAVRYQLVHALAIVLCAVAGRGEERRALHGAGWVLAAGTLLFSGSLIALALTGWRALGAVTPFGGLVLLAGWLLLARALWRAR